jgi:hypothetical protein
MFGEAQLDALQSVLNELLPEWSRALRVGEDEESLDSAVVGREGRLYDCLHVAAPPRRGLGHATLSGGYDGLTFFLSHCEGTLPPELNRFSIELYNVVTVEGRAISSWAHDMLAALAALMPVRFADARTHEEFDAKNMIDDETGTRAIGRRLAKCLPGLYWLNFFGPPYVELMCRHRLLSAPAYEVKPVGDGVLIALDSSAGAWQTPEYKKREQEVIEHLGKQYFFSRFEPERQTVAPDFRAHPDRPVGH